MSYKQSGDLIYDDVKGMICQLSDPDTIYIEHIPITIHSICWGKAMETAKRIIEAEDCLRQVQSIAGPNWREWLATAEQVMRPANIVVEFGEFCKIKILIGQYKEEFKAYLGERAYPQTAAGWESLYIQYMRYIGNERRI